MATQTVDRVNSGAQLPLIDPDYLIVERRPERLHAYARGLLQHLQHVRAGKSAQGYPIVNIRSATVWLIKWYEATATPLTPEAAQLLDAIVPQDPEASTSPVRRSNEKAYWAAISFEALQHPDPRGKQPSVATLYAVAKHVYSGHPNRYASQKSAEATVRGWRRYPHYRYNVALQRRAPLE
jgi:hypothetical protein